MLRGGTCILKGRKEKKRLYYRGDAISNQPVKPIIAYRKYLWTHVCTHYNKSPVFVLNSIHFFQFFFFFFLFDTDELMDKKWTFGILFH